MKKIFILLSIFFLTTVMWAQESDDDFFFDDDDGIIELDTTTIDDRTKELSYGTLFETGSIKISGSFTTSLATSTVVYADDDKTFWNHLEESTLTPSANAMLSVDARPKQTLRMFTKFGIAYPYSSKAISSLQTTVNPPYFSLNTTIADWLTMKELFTDFSVADRAFFRFGLHTVSWGTGYFFSPVSDMINTSSINPEDTDAQVDGSVNLRTQITFPGTQNCLWLYVIPSAKFTNNYSTETYLKDTALAGKGDLVLGGWELGGGLFWKYENPLKLMFTATGSIIKGKVNVFGEAVYQHGTDTEWEDSQKWNDKTSIFQLTAGAMYYWKDPQIMIAAQYYYDSNSEDLVHKYFTHGHNIAAVVNFSKIFDAKDLTAMIFGMVNFGKEDLPESTKNLMNQYGISSSFLSCATISGMLNYSPIDSVTFTFGPYLTWETFESTPVLSIKLSAKLGGGKF